MRYRVIIVSIALVACNRDRHAADAPGCARPEVNTATWEHDSTGSVFAMRLPPTFHLLERGGLDSEGAFWEGRQGRLNYDYGAYSNPLTTAPFSSGHTCDVTIGGRRARVVEYRDSAGFHVGAHWSGFPEQGMGPVSLTLLATARDSAQLPVLLASLWTVTFRDKSPLKE